MYLRQMVRVAMALSPLLLTAPAFRGQETVGSSKLRVLVASAAFVTIAPAHKANDKTGAGDLAGSTSFSYNIRNEQDAGTGILQFALARETDAAGASANATDDTLSWGCFEDSRSRSCLNEHSKVGPVQTAFFSVAHDRKSNISAGTVSWKLSDDSFENSAAHTTVTLTVSGI